MADKNQLKIANQTEFSDDDPFAELTRIMGFDPRQPATREQAVPASGVPQTAASAPVAAHQDAGFGDDDFSLDLEKELLGSFDLEDDFGLQAQEAVPLEQELPQSGAGYGQAPMSDSAHDDFEFALDFDAAMGASSADSHHAGRPEGNQTTSPQGVGSGETAAPHSPQDDLEFALDAFDLHGVDQGSDRDEPPVVAKQPEAPDVDFGLFEDFDFSLPEEHPAPADPAPSFRSDAQPRSSDQELSASHGSQPDENSAFPGHDDQFYAETQTTWEPEINEERDADEFHALTHASAEPSFDELELDPETSAPGTEYVAAEEHVGTAQPEATRPGAFEFSIPAYVPRKLPVSPMDVAAEEYRQREANPAPTAPAFSMEDELNALLGNLRNPQKPEPAVEPNRTPVSEAYAPEVDAESSNAEFDLDIPGYKPEGEMSFEPPFEPRVDAPAAVSLPISPMEVERAQASVAGDPFGNEAGIEDDLDWEFDETFALDTAPAPTSQNAPEVHDPRETQYQAVHPTYDDERLHEGQQDHAYAAPDEELFEPIDLEEAFGDLSEEPQPEPQHNYPSSYGSQAYGTAFAGAAAAAAVGQAAPAFSRTQQPPQAASWNDGHAGQGSDMWTATSHRDPVVRGDPLKEDPLNVIEKLADQYSRGDLGGDSASVTHSARDEFEDDFNISEFFDGQPEVETVEVDDRSVSLAHDFEIPDLPEEEQVPQASAYDDIDAEFSNLLGDMNAELEGSKPAPTRADSLSGTYNAGAYGAAAPGRGNADPVLSAQPKGAQADPFKLDDALYEGLVQSGSHYASNGDYELEPEFEQEYRQPASDKKGPFSRNLLIGGAVAAVAILGAIGAFALSFGGGQDTPTLVRADDGPVKVRPENPGGATVPNQDNKVYDAVAGGTGDGAPSQEALVTTAEEPVDVAPSGMEDDDMMMSGKSEDRIEQIVRDAEDGSDAELVAVAPRKVRTMVVRPDGTLVPREDDPAEATDTMPTATSSLPEAEAPVALAPAAEAPAPQAAPATAAPEAAPAQVAAATTAAASAGGWAMQIASQPSEAAAQTSYQDLARRYPSVLGGRQVNIVRAEVAGKGTFWRVRVMADSRNEAISLCESYKSAGGSCFVSR